jgi:hypothetical protein
MWWNRIIANACRKTGLAFSAVYDARIAGLGEHRGIHIIRDPRDIAVSAYFSHLHSHSVKEWSELEDYRENLRGMSKDDGLATEIHNRKTEFGQLESWDYRQPQVLEVKFESLADSSYDVVLRAFQHLGLVDESDYSIPQRMKGLFLDVVDGIAGKAGSAVTRPFRSSRITGAELLAIAWKFRFQSLAGGRKQGVEDVTSHFRKGRPGDWVNHFTADHKSLFKELYPDLLTTLGYESSNDW